MATRVSDESQTMSYALSLDNVRHFSDTYSDIDIDFRQDSRVKWIKERLLTFFGIDDDEIFWNMLEEENVKENLSAFIAAPSPATDSSLKKKIFFVHHILVDKLIHVSKEVTEWRIEPPPPRPPTPPLKKGKKGKKGAEKEKAKAEPKEKKGKGKKGATEPDTVVDESEFDDVLLRELEEDLNRPSVINLQLEEEVEASFKEAEPAEKEEDDPFAFPKPPENLDPEVDGTLEYYTVVRVHPMTIKYPKIVPDFGSIEPSEIIRNKKYIYMLRRSEDPVPMFDSERVSLLKMSDYFLVGSVNGKMLMNLGMQLREAYIPLFKNQFREINAGDHASSMSLQAEEAEISYAGFHHEIEETKTSQVTYLRPSDYRRMSSVARGENAEMRIRMLRTDSNKEEMRKHKQSVFFDKAPEIKKIPPKLEIKEKNKPASEEIIDDIESLVKIVHWTIEHVEGEVLMPMPNIPQLAEEEISEELLQDPEFVSQLEQAVVMWENHIDTTITNCLGKTKEGQGPVAEYEYWRERDAELSILMEQMKAPIVVKILNLLEKADTTFLEGFQSYRERLQQQYSQARDNLKFLSTLLRFFIVIEDDSPLRAVLEMLPEMVEGIYMVWVLSKGYRTDETMVPLMSRISWSLCHKLETVLAVETLFDKPNAEVLVLAREGQKVMELWHDLYRETRRNIELSGKGARWEFDQNYLFTRTDYIGTVARDLKDGVQVMIEFENVFGAELKSIISDPTQIDAVRKRVKNLIFPIRTIDFSVFYHDNKENWDVIMTDFWKEVAYLENEAKNYINQSFANLRSSEEALDMLLKFLKFETRDSIREQLSNKFDLVMRQFIKEITTLEDLFTRQRKNPPLLRNHPPAAGCIFWARMLMNKLKIPVMKFQKVPELSDSEQKREAFLLYKNISKTIKEYEEAKYRDWVKGASNFIDKTMKKNLLQVAFKEESFGGGDVGGGGGGGGGRMQLTAAGKALVSKRKAASVRSLQPPDVVAKKIADKRKRDKTLMLMRIPGKHYENVRSPSSISLLAKEGLTDVTWRDLTVSKLMLEHELEFQLNFNRRLFQEIKEAELMEELGMNLPPNIRNVAMQKDRIYYELEALEDVITKYNKTLDSLTPSELYLMKKHLLAMELHILPGLTRITWTALGITDYIKDITKGLNSLQAVQQQLKMVEKEILFKIDQIEQFDLFPVVLPENYVDPDTGEPDSTWIHPCKTFFVEVEFERLQRVSMMSRIYERIGPILMKLEYLILGTSTGKSSIMTAYYEFWEKKIFRCLIILVKENLEMFQQMLGDTQTMFQVDAMLAPPEIVVKPTAMEVCNIIGYNIKHFLNRLTAFPRWMKKTCIPCAPQRIAEATGNEFYVFSFFEDVLRVVSINDVTILIQDTIHRLTQDVNTYVQKYVKLHIDDLYYALFQLQGSLNVRIFVRSYCNIFM